MLHFTQSVVLRNMLSKKKTIRNNFEIMNITEKYFE